MGRFFQGLKQALRRWDGKICNEVNKEDFMRRALSLQASDELDSFKKMNDEELDKKIRRDRCPRGQLPALVQAIRHKTAKYNINDPDFCDQVFLEVTNIMMKEP